MNSSQIISNQNFENENHNEDFSERNQNESVYEEIKDINIVNKFDSSLFFVQNKDDNLNQIQDKLRMELLPESGIKECTDKAIILRNSGNQLFREERYDDALEKFKSALELLNSKETLWSKEIKESNYYQIKNEISNNIGLCYLNQKKFEEAILTSNSVLSSNKQCLRALYIKAKSLKYLGKLEEAYEIIKYALTLKTNISLLKEHSELEYQLNSKQRNITSFSNYNSLKNPKFEDIAEDIIKTQKSNWFILKVLKITSSKFVDFLKRDKLLLITIIALALIAFKQRINFKRLFEFGLMKNST